MKLTQARQKYKCHECKKNINKGDKYKYENYFHRCTVGHVIRVTAQLCFNCATKGMNNIDLQVVLRKEIKESINNIQRRINNE